MNVLIDTGPDLRQQMLQLNVKKLECVLYTHYHYDHMGGLNDLKPFSFRQKEPLDCYCNEQTKEKILYMYPYIMKSDIQGQVSLRLLDYSFNGESVYESFCIGDLEVQPIRLMHVKPIKMECVGFVFNKKIGYLTDFKAIFKGYKTFLTDLDALIVGAPLYREHPNHLSIPQALELIQELSPQKGIVGHIGHEFSYKQLSEKFPPDAEPAYDGLNIKF